MLKQPKFMKLDSVKNRILESIALIAKSTATVIGYFLNIFTKEGSLIFNIAKKLANDTTSCSPPLLNMRYVEIVASLKLPFEMPEFTISI